LTFQAAAVRLPVRNVRAWSRRSCCRHRLSLAGAASPFRGWRQRRKERKTNAWESNLQHSLTFGSFHVQGEYDGDFSRLGRQFAVVDGRRGFPNPVYDVELGRRAATSRALSLRAHEESYDLATDCH
jgi:hypothetical protein